MRTSHRDIEQQNDRCDDQCPFLGQSQHDLEHNEAGNELTR